MRIRNIYTSCLDSFFYTHATFVAEEFAHETNCKDLPGNPDLFFPKYRAVIFVHGCFWHRCPRHATSPKSNGSWWEAKLATNVARDADTDTRLRGAGWTVLRVWEHEDPVAAADRVEACLDTVPGDARCVVPTRPPADGLRKEGR